MYMLISFLLNSDIFFMPPFEEEGAYCFANVGRYVGRSVCWSVCLSVDQMVPIIILKTIYHSAFIFHMLIGLSEDKTPFDYEFTMSKIKVT